MVSLYFTRRTPGLPEMLYVNMYMTVQHRFSSADIIRGYALSL